jgi:hypothetical protein
MRRFAPIIASTAALAGCFGGGYEDHASPGGGLTALAGSRVSIGFRDGPPTIIDPGERTLTFSVTSLGSTPAECAWLDSGTTVKFNGELVRKISGGGWHTGSSDNFYGGRSTWDECYPIYITVPLMKPVGEPQNGALEIEGKGLRFAVGFEHTIGQSELALTSIRRDSLVVQPRNFLVALGKERFNAVMYPAGEPSAAAVERYEFADGELKVILYQGGTPGGKGTLSVVVSLGPGKITSCMRFAACEAPAPSILLREFDVVVP